jgi:rubrerythrin
MSSVIAQTNNDVTILNTAIGLEQQAQWTYGAAAKTNLLKPEVVTVATKIAGQHKEHETALSAAVRQLGGTPPTAKDTYPLPELKSQEDILKYALSLETAAANAYFDAFTKLSSNALKLAGISIMNDESQHVVVLRSALGLDPVQGAFFPLPEYKF